MENRKPSHINLDYIFLDPKLSDFAFYILGYNTKTIIRIIVVNPNKSVCRFGESTCNRSF